MKQTKKADYNGFRGGRNLLKLLSDKTANLSVPGQCGPDGRHICLPGKCRFSGMSARSFVKRKPAGGSLNRSLP